MELPSPKHLQLFRTMKIHCPLFLMLVGAMVLLIKGMEGDSFEFLLERFNLLCLMNGQSLRLPPRNEGVRSGVED